MNGCVELNSARAWSFREAVPQPGDRGSCDIGVGIDEGPDLQRVPTPW
jgi:hypothetical protein